LIPVVFTVPGPPVPKGRPRMTRAGHAYTPARTVAYEKLVRVCATGAMGGRDPIEGRVDVAIDLFMPDRRRADIDNLAKGILDAGNGVLWRDDSQITQLVLRRDVDPENPRAIVTVAPAFNPILWRGK
jgi:Holliday junction resolvase RusA-like endonuclease